MFYDKLLRKQEISRRRRYRSPSTVQAFPPATVDGTGLPTGHRRRYRPPHRPPSTVPAFQPAFPPAFQPAFPPATVDDTVDGSRSKLFKSADSITRDSLTREYNILVHNCISTP